MEIPIIRLKMFGEPFGFYREYSSLLNFNICLISNKIIRKDAYNVPYDEFIDFENRFKNVKPEYFSYFLNISYSRLFFLMDRDGYEVIDISLIDIICKQEEFNLDSILFTCDYVLNSNKKFGILYNVERLKKLIIELKEYNNKLPIYFKKKYAEYFI